MSMLIVGENWDHRLTAIHVIIAINLDFCQECIEFEGWEELAHFVTQASDMTQG